MIYEGRVDCNVLFRGDPVGRPYSLEQPNSVGYYMGILIGQEGVRDGRLEINVGTHGEVAWE